jgi:hypothetical protein
MAITIGTTQSSFSSSSTNTSASHSHTIDAGTDVLLVTVALQGFETVSGTPQWQGDGESNQNLTLIHASTSSGSNNDVRVYIYALLNPSGTTGTTAITLSSNITVFASSTNWIGTETSSLGDAVKYISEEVSNVGSETSTQVLPAGTQTTGSTLIIASVFYGGDGNPSTDDTAGSEWFDGDTGTGPSDDISYRLGGKFGGGGFGAVTVNWSSSDSCAAVLIEINEPASVNTTIEVPTGPVW